MIKCANCGNTDERFLWDEDDTILCSKCYHRTLKSTGRDDLVKCPCCGEMRDRKASYCRHCGHSWGVKISGKDKHDARKSVKLFRRKK